LTCHRFISSIASLMNADTLTLNLQSIVQPHALDKPVNVRDALAALDQFCREDSNMHPRLRHYLEKRSYAKALAWLDNPDLPHQS
jgi:hypothetical protein